MTLPTLRIILFTCLALLFITGLSTAATPQWMADKPVKHLLVSDDGSAIIGSGHNLYYLTKDGTVSWTEKTYDSIDVSGNGGYVIAGSPYAVLFDAAGNKLWEKENTGDSATTEDPLHVQISQRGDLILTSTGRAFHTWGVSGVQIGGNTSYYVTEFDEEFTGAAVTPSGDEIILFTTEGIYSVNRSGFLFSRFEDDVADENDWKCRIGILSEDGQKVVCGYDNSLYYGYSSGTMLWEKRIAGDDITGLVVSSEKDPVIVAGSLDGYVYVVDAGGNTLWKYRLFAYRTGQPITVSVSRDGSYLTARSLDTKTMNGAVFLFNRQGDLIWYTEGEDAVGAVTPDGSALLIGTAEHISSYAVADLIAAAAGTTTAPTTPPPTGQPVSGTMTTQTMPPATATTSQVPVAGPGSETTIPATTQGAPVASVLPVLACVLVIAAYWHRG